jgi:hypothetical protein
MNEHDEAGDGAIDPRAPDWRSLGDDWRAQVGEPVDSAHLVADVRRRGRRLRVACVAELVVSLIVIGLCLWAARWPEASGLPREVTIAAIVFVLGCQVWSLWIRRRQWRDSGLDMRALLTLEQDRIVTSQRYWRFNIWAVVGIWTGLAAWLLYATSPAAGDAARFARSALVSLLVNLLVLLGFALYAWWSARRNRARLARMRQLREELELD